MAFGLLRKLDRQYGVPPTVPQTVLASLIPILCMSILFMVWGLIYGMLDVMNNHIAKAMDLASKSSSLMATSYYSAYLYVPLFVAGPLISHGGYRFTCVYGLFILSVGALVFAIAGQIRSFALLCVGQHLCGHAVSALETAANPYVTNAGPKKYRVLRMLWCHSLCALGTVLAPMIADKVLYATAASEDADSTCVLGVGRPPSTATVEGNLDSTITLYFGIAACSLFLTMVYGVIFFSTNIIREVPQSKAPKSTCGWHFWNHGIFSMAYSRLWLGCFTNFFNIASQVTVAQFIIPHLEINACETTKDATKSFRDAQILFLAGRLIAAALVAIGVLPGIRDSKFSVILKSRIVLLVFVAGAIGCAAASGVIKGQYARWVASAIMLFEAPTFPTIFEAATVGLGNFATVGESMMILSIAGGLAGPPAFGAIRDDFGVSNGWFLVTGFFCIVLSFPLFTNLVPSWRLEVDQGEVTDLEHLDLRELSNVGSSENPKKEGLIG